MVNLIDKRPFFGKLRTWLVAGLMSGLLSSASFAWGEEVSYFSEPEPGELAASEDGMPEADDPLWIDDAYWPCESPLTNTIYESPFFSAPICGYGAGCATTPTIYELSIMDFPGIVNTVTEDLIWDRSSITLEDAMEMVPNVTSRTGNGFRNDEFYIRGFNVGFASNDFRKDGFRDSSWAKREVQNLERIEVLKGPASALYGSAAQPAGVISLITKKPLNARFAEADVMLGSYGLFRTVGDINTPLFGNENALARINYVVQDSDSFRDFVYVDRQFVAPAFTFALDSQTTLTIQGEYLHDERPVDRGLVFFPNTPAGNPFAAPIGNYYGQPTDNNEYHDGQFNIFLNHEINDRWFWQLGYASNWSSEDRNNYDTRSVIGNNVVRQFVTQQSTVEDHYFIGNLTGQIEGPLFKHRLLVGTELGTSSGESFSRNSVVTGFPLNVFNPYTTPGANYSLYPAVPALGAPLTSSTALDQYGLYVEDLIEITPHIKGLVGVRSNWYELETTSNGVPSENSGQIWTPRYGLVFEPLPEDLSFYAAYSTTFNPVVGLQPGGAAPVEPEQGWGLDIGTKARLHEQLWLTVGYFDVERTNIAQAIPATNPAEYTQFGTARSTGVEVQLFGQLTERWSMMNSFATADARIVRDRVPANVGLALPHTPDWQGSLWTRYNFYQEVDCTFGAGFGLLYTDDWYITADNQFSLPGYTRFDCALFYDVGRWRSMLFIENLTDEEYAVGANNSTTVMPGAPISLRGTVGVTF